MISAFIKHTLTRTFAQNIPKKKPVHQQSKVLVSDIIGQIISNKTIQSPADWSTVRNEMLNSSEYVSEKNIDLLTLNHCLKVCDYSLGKKYLEFLQQNDLEANLATTGRFLRLFYYAKLNNKISDKDEEDILSIYKDLKHKHEAFDSYTSENLILALSKTKQWACCVHHLEELKLLCTPNDLVYSAIVCAALENKDIKLSEKLLQEMLDSGRTPSNDVYLAYLDYCESSNKFEKHITDLLHLLQRYDLKINKQVASKLITAVKKNHFKGNFVNIDSRGTCQFCSNRLDLLQVTTEEFEQLKAEFFKHVIIGKNIFTKSTPEELERFKDFINKMDKFDVVIDGLNVSYLAGTKHSSEIVSKFVVAVVEHFVKQKKKVLVCGRLHMKKWPKKNLAYIYSNASVFLAENLSKDDPYLLYCALSCGLNTIIVSRDLMRSHLFLLKNPYHKSLFGRWLAQNLHQINFINNRGKVIFKQKLPYLPCVQKNGNVWHVPYEIVDSDNLNWICLTL